MTYFPASAQSPHLRQTSARMHRDSSTARLIGMTLGGPWPKRRRNAPIPCFSHHVGPKRSRRTALSSRNNINSADAGGTAVDTGVFLVERPSLCVSSARSPLPSNRKRGCRIPDGQAKRRADTHRDIPAPVVPSLARNCFDSNQTKSLRTAPHRRGEAGSAFIPSSPQLIDFASGCVRAEDGSHVRNFGTLTCAPAHFQIDALVHPKRIIARGCYGSIRSSAARPIHRCA